METWNKLQAIPDWGNLPGDLDANARRDLDRDETIARLLPHTAYAQAAVAGVFHKQPAAPMPDTAESQAASATLRAELRRLNAMRDAAADTASAVERSASRAKAALDEIEAANAQATTAIDADIAQHFREQLADESEDFDLDNLPVSLKERHSTKAETAHRLALLRDTYRSLTDEAKVKFGVLETLRQRCQDAAWQICRYECDALLDEYLAARRRYEQLDDAMRALAKAPRGNLTGIGHASPAVMGALAPRADWITGSANDPRVRAIQRWVAFRTKLLVDPDAVFGLTL